MLTFKTLKAATVFFILNSIWFISSSCMGQGCCCYTANCPELSLHKSGCSNIDSSVAGFPNTCTGCQQIVQAYQQQFDYAGFTDCSCVYNGCQQNYCDGGSGGGDSTESNDGPWYSSKYAIVAYLVTGAIVITCCVKKCCDGSNPAQSGSASTSL